MHPQAARLGVSTALATLFVFGMLTAIPQAKAATSLTCTTSGGDDVTDVAPISIGEAITCSSSTANPSVVASITTVTDGSGTIVSSTPAAGSTAAAAFVVTNTGVWEVRVDYFDASGVISGTELVNIVVSFFVIPESPIGIIALVGSALAAMAGFVVLRSRSQSLATIKQ